LVIFDQGSYTAFGKVGDVRLGGEKVQDAVVPFGDGTVKAAQGGFARKSELRGFHFNLMGMGILVGLEKVFVPLEGEGAAIQNNFCILGPLSQGFMKPGRVDLISQPKNRVSPGI
jgi:hypothetical protein